MKVSELTLADICQQIRTEEAYLTENDKNHIAVIRKAAVEYVKSYTGLNDLEVDAHEDITVAVLVLISDMYDNRQMYVDKGNVNRVVDSILGMYCVNLL